MAIGTQKQGAAPVVEMDAGRFLHAINIGAQAQVKLFAERIERMGEEVGTKWRLVALHSNALLFEDIDNAKYYQAEVQRLGKGRVKIGNIVELRIVESRKEDTFHKNVDDLVEAIANTDNSRADMTFNRLIAQRLRASVIPAHGLVETRDGQIRHVNVANTVVDESMKPEIIKAICEALSDNVKVSRGRIVEAVFNNVPIKFPVNELTRRRVVARSMKNVAVNAYLSEGFQSRIEHLAALISQDQVEQAVENVATFLKEEQEFSLLDLNETQRLAGNALAAKGCFNAILAEDVGKLIYRTGCRVNRDVIIENWRQVARLSEYAPFVENIRILEESKEFEKDYQDFLHVIFTEDMTTKAAKAKMYLHALKDMKNVLTGSNSDVGLIESLDQIIVRMETAGEEIDDATLMEVEELVASTSETLMDDIATLDDYSKIPEPPRASPQQFGKDLGAEPEPVEPGGGGAGPALPLGGPEELMPEEELGEGEVGEKEEEEEEEGIPGLTLDSKAQNAEPLTEAEIKEAISKLTSEQLRADLVDWQKNTDRYFKEDGAEGATLQLEGYTARAEELQEADLSAAFKQLLIENTSSGLPNVEADPYKYMAPSVKINQRYGLVEDNQSHVNQAKTMKQSKLGGQIGSAEGSRGDAMGRAGETDMNVAKDAGHREAILKSSSKMPTEGLICCDQCKAECDMAECMVEGGAICPECGAPMDEKIMEALELKENLKDEGHKMDHIGGSKGSVACPHPAKTDARSGHGGKGSTDLAKMGGQEGKGVAGEAPQQSDGASADGGKTEPIEQPGKGVAEDQYKSGIKRRLIGISRSSFAKKEEKAKKDAALAEGQTTIVITDTPVDEVVAKIASTLAGDEGIPEIPGLTPEMAGEVTPPDEVPPPEEVAEKTPPEEITGETGELPPELEEPEEELEEPEEEEGEEGEKAEEEAEEEAKSEGKLPEHLKKFQFKKKGGSEKKGEEEEEPKSEDKAVEKTVTEDDNITAPHEKGYDTAEVARKDGAGKMMREKPKFATKDYKGTVAVKTAKPIK